MGVEKWGKVGKSVETVSKWGMVVGEVIWGEDGGKWKEDGILLGVWGWGEILGKWGEGFWGGKWGYEVAERWILKM